MNIFREVEKRWGRDREKGALTIRSATGGYRSFSYGLMFDRVDEYARGMREAGMASGDRIALIGENSPEWVIAFLAIAKLDCTAVLIDPSVPDPATDDFLHRSEPRAVLASPKVLSRLSTDLPVFDILTAERAGEGGRYDSGTFPRIGGDPSLAAILFSSGTTSTAKGVMHRHGALMTMAEKMIEHNGIVDTDRFLAVIPLCHIYGLMAGLVCPLLAGSRLCFLESAVSEDLLAAFKEFRPTGFGGVPRIFNLFKARILDTARSRGPVSCLLFRALLATCAAARRTTGLNVGRIVFARVHGVFGGAIRGFLSAGAYIDPAVVRFFYGLGFYLLNNYGLTETGIPVAANSLSYFTFDTCGEMFQGIRVKIRGADEDGAGEILVKSEGMMAGYFRDEEATRAAFDAEGWFLTGDLGYLDERGDLVVTGRTKENIVLATGKKLAPDDVEGRYQGIAGVAELVVCGVRAQADASDEIHCFIVKDEKRPRNDGAIREDIEAAGASLPDYMRIRRTHFLTSIPRTSLQKPKRYLLGRMALGAKKTEDMEDAESPRLGEEARAVFDAVRGIASRLNIGDQAITGSTRLVEDLGFDSLTVTEFLAILRNETGRDLFRVLKPNLSVNDLVRALASGAEPPSTGEDGLQGYPVAKRRIDTILYGLLTAFSRFAYRFKVEGSENIPAGGGYLLCPNHETHLDGLWVLMHLPEGHRRRFCCMAKKEHLDNPIGRLLLRIAGGIPVDRYGNPAPAYERCLEKLKEGWIVLIHPEGTRTSDGIIGAFKHGSAKLSMDSGLPIVPVRIKGGYALYPKSRRLPKLFDLRRMKRYEVSVSFGKPLRSSGNEVEGLTLKLSEAVINL